MESVLKTASEEHEISAEEHEISAEEHEISAEEHEISAEEREISAEEHETLANDDLSENYTVQRKLGRGSQGCVYLGTRQVDGKKVFIKRLDINSIKTWKEYALFKREGDVLKARHIT